MVNWGNSHDQPWQTPNVRIFNKPEVVRLAANKLLTFQKFQEAGFTDVPEWTITREQAATWIANGGVAVCRTVLNGHSGRGIVVAEREDQLVNAPLYTQYVKKKKEFRVHVGFGVVVDVQEKRQRRADNPDAEREFRVRNLQTGWVYCREQIDEPASLRETACRAIDALGLDFGAVDIIWNERQDKCYVLEVNTACGLEGTTLENYAQLFAHKVG